MGRPLLLTAPKYGPQFMMRYNGLRIPTSGPILEDRRIYCGGRAR